MSDKKREITGLNFNWYTTPENGEEFTSVTVGNVYQNGVAVTEIIEHNAAGEGDKWFYDINYSDGTTTRVFNPNAVFYSSPHKN